MTSRLMRWLGRTAPSTPPAAFELEGDLYTDAGPVRSRNEDCIAALGAPRPAAAGSLIRLVALADGMGGHQAGALASRLAVQAALQRFGAGDPVTTAALTRQRLHDALVAANAAVFEQAGNDPAFHGMGTTLLLCAPSAEGLCYAWVGDSRLYHWHGGRLQQLSRDDTVVRGLLERGLIAPHEVVDHPDRSVLTQAVGTGAAIAAPHVEGPVPVVAGDRLLLCSDGIHDVVADAALAVALGAGSPCEARQEIHRLALAGQADDNLSIAVLQVIAPPLATASTRPTRPLELMP